MVVVAMVVMVSHLMATRWRGFHHPQHPTAAGAQEPPAEDAGERKRGDIEKCRVDPGWPGLKRIEMVVGRDETEQLEQGADDQPRQHYRETGGAEQEEAHPDH